MPSDQPHAPMKRRFLRSARKHRIAYADIRHAIGNVRHTEEQSARKPGHDTRIVHLGPARNGMPLEIVSVIADGDTLLVIHAMPMRRKYRDRYDHSG